MMHLPESSRSYAAVDYMKLFCAFLVVCIHAEPFDKMGLIDNVFSVLTRIAVPFFFVFTAFFFSLKPVSWKRCLGYIKRIFIMYLSWSVLYFAARWLLNGAPDENMLYRFFVSGYQHLWFLQACIVSVLLMTAILTLFRKNGDKALLIISSVLFVFGCLISTYSPLTTRLGVFKALYDSPVIHFTGTRNGIYYGLFFFAMGRRLAVKEKHPPLKVSLAGAAFSFVLLGAEGLLAVRVLHTDQTILWLSTAPLVFFICSACLDLRIKSNSLCAASAFIRKCSTGIYLVHMLILLILETHITNGIALTAAVFLLSFAVSAAYYAALFRIKKTA